MTAAAAAVADPAGAGPVPGSVAWHATRAAGVGSSEIAALFGAGFKDKHGRAETPLKVYLSKVLPPEALAAEPTKAVFQRGSHLERALAEGVAEQRGWRIVRVPTQRDALGDPLVSSIDFLILDANGEPWAILECKTAGFRTLPWGDPDAEPDGVPDRVLLQVQHQMAVGLDWNGRRVYPRLAFVVACVNHIDDVRVYEVPHRPKLETVIRERCRAFWREHVVPRVPPAWDGSEAGDRLLVLLHPTDRAPLRRVPDSDPIVAVVAARTEVHARIKADEALRDTLDQRIKASIGDAEGIRLPAGVVTWKANKDGEKTDWQAVAAELQRELADLVSEAAAVNAASAAARKHTRTTRGARVLRGPWSAK